MTHVEFVFASAILFLAAAVGFAVYTGLNVMLYAGLL